MAPAVKVRPVPLLLALLGVAAVVSALMSTSYMVRRDPQHIPPMVTIIVMPTPPKSEPRAAPAAKKPAAEAPADAVREQEAARTPMERQYLRPRDRQSFKLEVLATSGAPVAISSMPPPACGSPAMDESRSLDLAGFPAFDAPATTPDALFFEALCKHVETYRPTQLVIADEGLALVRVRIDRSGALIEARVEQGSGSERLDAEALAMIHRATRFPMIPPELPDPLEVVLPIRFPALEAAPR